MADMARYEAEQASIVWPAKARAGRLHTPPVQMGAGSTKARWRLSVTLRGAPTVNSVIKIGCADLRPVADPWPAYPLIIP